MQISELHKQIAQINKKQNDQDGGSKLPARSYSYVDARKMVLTSTLSINTHNFIKQVLVEMHSVKKALTSFIASNPTKPFSIL